MNLAILLSGRGSNFESIYEATQDGRLPAKIRLVASNNPKAIGLKTARSCDIPTCIFDRRRFDSGKDFTDFILKMFLDYEIDLIILAGYMRKIPPRVVREYDQRIINIHPALLPKFGGKGMYGIRVHEAVIDSGEKETGVTVHYVNEKYDEGKIIAQEKTRVLVGETAEELAKRVLQIEHDFYPQVIGEILRKTGTKS